MNLQTACFTGHRKIELYEYEIIKQKLKIEIEKLILKGVKYFGCGGAIGFDTMAGLTVLELKRKYNNIHLIMVLPCKNQDLYWNEYDKIIYKKLLNNASKTIYISNNFTPICMFERNNHLLKYSKYCICYLRKNYSGTGYNVRRAIEMGLEIIYL